jgi:MFS transporter, DHA1 family, staphyloferrin A biosynthesis exporter
MERVATGWLALETGGGPLAVGIVFAARMVPSLLLGLAAGTIADRMDRRRLLLAVAAGGAALAATFGLLIGTGVIALWQVAAIAFLSGCVQVFDTPARQALVYDTVGRATAPNAIALNAVAARLFGAVGAFAGGVVIPTFGVANSYFVVAASFLVGLGLIALVRVQPTGAWPSGPRPSFGQALVGAGRLILDRPAVRTLVLASMVCEVFAFSYMTTVPTIARDILEAGPEGLGTLTAASAVGATFAVILLAGLPASVRREPLLAGVFLLYGIALLAFAAAPTLLIAVAVMLVVGGCAAAFDALQQVLIQLAVPEDQRGRAVGVWAFSIGTAPIGHIEVGALAATVGAPAALTINGFIVIAGALALVARAPAFRWQRTRADAGI